MLEYNMGYPVTLPVSGDLKEVQRSELAQQVYWMANPAEYYAEENLRPGPPRLVTAGVEKEFPIVDEEGRLGDAGPVIEAYPNSATSEFPNAAVEWISKPLSIDYDFLANLSDFHFEAWSRSLAVFPDRGGIPLGIGYYPNGTDDPNSQRELMCRRKARYKHIDNSLTVRNGRLSVRMTNLEGDLVIITSDGGPYIPGLSFSEHINMCGNRPGSVANAAIVSAAAVTLLAANSPFCRVLGNDVIGCNCTRWPMWHLIGKSPFGLGRYYSTQDVRASLEWSRFLVENGEMIVPFEESQFHGHPLGVTHYASTTMWMKTDRMRHGWDPHRKRIVLRNENRIADTQLTAHDSVAVYAFVLGLTQSLTELFERVDPAECIPYQVAEASAQNIALWGHAATNWMSERMSVENLTKNIFLPMALNGLDSLGINPEHSRFFMNSIKWRLEQGSPSLYLLKSFKEIEDSRPWPTRGDAVKEVLKRLALQQMKQAHPLTDTGYCSWDLL